MGTEMSKYHRSLPLRALRSTGLGVGGHQQVIETQWWRDSDKLCSCGEAPLRGDSLVLAPSVPS